MCWGGSLLGAHFALRWAPLTRLLPPPAKASEKGIALTELLGRVKGVIDEGFAKAEWVSAEISELRGKNGHLYLTLTERNDQGDILAQIKGVIWRNRAQSITAKFEGATGEGLKTDIKILCLARVRFDPLYGLDLIIEDVDPSYTLGDLAAKLARTRDKLQRTGLYERNKQLPSPVEFVRVAVISPETSAGLGDFRGETDRLQAATLCELHLFPATFQGVETSPSIQSAVLQVLTAHKQKPFDALAIIRGGGSVIDLAWLNDRDLAKLLCQSPVPILTGIGHERDNTIIDEIPHTRFDTPSKVALHISTTIKDNALAAIQAWERINALVGRIILRERTMLIPQADRVETGVRDEHQPAMTGDPTVESPGLLGTCRSAGRWKPAPSLPPAARGTEPGTEAVDDDGRSILSERAKVSRRSWNRGQGPAFGMVECI